MKESLKNATDIIIINASLRLISSAVLMKLVETAHLYAFC